MLSKLEAPPSKPCKVVRYRPKLCALPTFILLQPSPRMMIKNAPRQNERWTQRNVKVVILFLKSFTKKLSSTLNLIAVGTICCAFLSRTKCYEMISSCNPAASADDSEGGGKRSRRRSPARTCIVPFSYLSQIPTASHLFADHFQGPQGLKGGGPGEGKCHSLLRQDTCRRPGPSSNPP